jgi:hypothetical protein
VIHVLPEKQIIVTLPSDAPAPAAACDAGDIVVAGSASQPIPAPSVSNIDRAVCALEPKTVNRENECPISRDGQQSVSREGHAVPTSSFSKAAEDASAGATAGRAFLNHVDCFA